MPIQWFYEVLKFTVTSIGVGFVNDKLFKRAGPMPPGWLNTITTHPLSPYIGGVLINKPGLVLTPAKKTGGALVALASKTGDALWSDKTINKGPAETGGGINHLANVFWAGLETFVSFAIAKPKVVGFIIVGGITTYLLLEPTAHSLLEKRRLDRIERHLHSKMREDALVRSMSKTLETGGITISELLSNLQTNSPGKNLEIGLASLSTEDRFRQREALLKALQCLNEK